MAKKVVVGSYAQLCADSKRMTARERLRYYNKLSLANKSQKPAPRVEKPIVMESMACFASEIRHGCKLSQARNVRGAPVKFNHENSSNQAAQGSK